MRTERRVVALVDHGLGVARLAALARQARGRVMVLARDGGGDVAHRAARSRSPGHREPSSRVLPVPPSEVTKARPSTLIVAMYCAAETVASIATGAASAFASSYQVQPRMLGMGFCSPVIAQIHDEIRRMPIQLLDQGRHEELLMSCSLYRELVSAHTEVA
jgi:hypothetical protein